VDAHRAILLPGLDNHRAISFADLQTEPIRRKLGDMVFITATDGNHGRGIAWAAARLGCRAVVYMPKGSALSRAEAIRHAGNADVTITDLNYDEAVDLAATVAADRGWCLVQDTAWAGYEDIPTWITQGYTAMSDEALEQLASDGVERPSHLFLQAGVGSMAGGVLGHYVNRFAGRPPVTTIVEPDTVACIYHSVDVGDGRPHAIGGNPVTIMAGLNCGRPNPLTWPILRDYASYYALCPDAIAASGMRILGRPVGGDARVVSGESGAVGVGLLALLAERPEFAKLRERMGLNPESVVLLFSTEGDTDPVNYQAIVNG
jgi:diaminopropionate ammonia-lyase